MPVQFPFLFLVLFSFQHGGEDSGVDTVDINAHLLGAIISVRASAHGGVEHSLHPLCIRVLAPMKSHVFSLPAQQSAPLMHKALFPSTTLHANSRGTIAHDSLPTFPLRLLLGCILSLPFSSRAPRSYGCPGQVIDIMLVAAEFRFRHIVSSWLFAVVYFAFNIIYFLAGPEDDKILYTVLDWEDNPGGAAVFAVLTIFILVPLLNLACCGLFRCVLQRCCASGAVVSIVSSLMPW